MSVVSERTFNNHRRSINNRSYRPSGFDSNRTVIGGDSGFDKRLLLPPFSASASEGPRNELAVENWADNTTIVTGNTSDHSYNGVPERLFQPLVQTLPKVAFHRCSRLCWVCSAFFISFLSLASAPAMVSIPILSNYFNLFENPWTVSNCEIECQGSLLSLSGKILLLFVTLYLLYWRRALADMPRLYFHRAAFSSFTFFFIFAFWLFYVVRIVLERNQNYISIVSYASSLVEVLLLIHCIWIFSELKQLKPVYTVRVLRDPDGELHTHKIGQMTIQEAAVSILRFYYTSFSMYNPYFDHARQSLTNGFRCRPGGVAYHPNECASGAGGGAGTGAGFKLYDIDGRGEPTLSEASTRILVEAASRRRMVGHNELFYEELEWDKRYKKRKYRLISCTEEVFSHVQSTNANTINFKVMPMDPSVAAKVVLGGVGKSLSRFLKFTRQQPFHPTKQVAEYLQLCLAYGFSARTFLQRFFYTNAHVNDSFVQSKWSILCDERASSSLRPGISFVLRSHNSNDSDRGIQLYCTFSVYPFLNITEQPTPQKSRFALKVTSDLSV